MLFVCGNELVRNALFGSVAKPFFMPSVYSLIKSWVTHIMTVFFLRMDRGTARKCGDTLEKRCWLTPKCLKFQ